MAAAGARGPIRDRSKTVLVLHGSGINCWPQYRFLRDFSLEELRELAAVVGVSGGSIALFATVLNRMGLFPEKQVARFDRLLNQTLNRRGLLRRVRGALRNEYVYSVDDAREFGRLLFGDEAAKLLFRDFPLPNYYAAVHDTRSNRLALAGARTTPELNVTSVLAGSSFPRRIGARKLCRGEELGGISPSDLDFAPKEVRRELYSWLAQTFPGHDQLHVNWFRESSRDGQTYVRIGPLLPRLSQLGDLAIFLAGLPNPKFRRMRFD